ncbi:MAG: acyP [Gammaproteobacteria bacterium]|nr:acyP [Gammaproteobacteria bacterium]
MYPVTREQAALFGITGWVRNLPDGRVEVMACGEEEQIKQLLEWLKRGPEMARVLKVEVVDDVQDALMPRGQDDQERREEFDKFSIRYISSFFK